ncbi:MAG: gas vesicle protein GvpN [Deinococcota bacterium]
MSVVVASRPKQDFVNTPYIAELTERAMGYLDAGFGLNLEGHAGSGKTTLAFHIAYLLGRPLVLMSGDEGLVSSDMVGRVGGFRRRKLVDNFIHSVVKVEEEERENWIDDRLTVACRDGYTLIYDEFTRSRAEANNILLPVLEERLLVLPSSQGSSSYIKVHPEFRAIFTSNPEDYAGVHTVQEALHDRLVTMELGTVDKETELAIVSRKSGLPAAAVKGIVEVVRTAHEQGVGKRTLGSIRASLQIAKVAAVRELEVSADNAAFCQIVFDVLNNSIVKDDASQETRTHLMQLLSEYTGDIDYAYA